MQEMQKLYQIEDIEQLTEHISTYLQKAIIIENDHFELVAYSSSSGYAFDPVQQKTILAKRCPLYVIERLKKEGIIEKLEKDHQPIRLNRMEDIDFFERIVVSLKVHGRICGYLWIYETEQLPEEALQFLSDVAPHLAQSVHKQQHEEEDKEQDLIWRLMNDEYLNETEIVQAARLAAYTLPEAFTILVYSVQDARSVYVLEKIKRILAQQGFSNYLGKGTEIIGIIHADKPKDAFFRAEKLMEDVTVKLEEKETLSLYVGAGEAYHNVSLMRKSYLEALEVIETMVFLDTSNQPVSHFNELGIYRYIKLMYKKNVSEQYRNDQLLTLMHHDRDNKSELLKTLWYFLKNDSRVALTAEALFIHPNTLNYRMKQITQLTTLNLNSMSEKMELYTQLMLIHDVADYWKFYMNGLTPFLNKED